MAVAPERAIFYIDGFNLYFGAVRGTPFKWLDIGKMCTALAPKNQIVGIKYFTAPVSSRPDDPDCPQRQQIYLRALRTVPNLSIQFGFFLEHVKWLRLASPPAIGNKFAKVVKCDEKGSDVNLATNMLVDAFENLYDTAIVVSNDSDLVFPISLVKQKFGKKVGIVNPQKQPSVTLKAQATFWRDIRTSLLSKCQFPNPITDSHGTFHKPPTW